MPDPSAIERRSCAASIERRSQPFAGRFLRDQCPQSAVEPSWARRTLLLSLLALLGSCSVKIPVRTSAATFPENRRLNLAVGYFMEPAMESLKTRISVTGGHEFVFPVGAQSTSSFEAMFSKLFRRSNALPARPSEAAPAQGVDATIEPRVEGISIEGPLAMGWSGVWSVELRCLFLFSDNAGHEISNWHVEANGQSAAGVDWTGFAGSDHANEAFANAFLDLERRFLDGFARVPEIRAWLSAKGVSASWSPASSRA
jgi:hypothetical protein